MRKWRSPSRRSASAAAKRREVFPQLPLDGGREVRRLRQELDRGLFREERGEEAIDRGALAGLCALVGIRICVCAMAFSS